MPQLDPDQALVLLDSYNRQIEAHVRQLNFLQAVLDETRRARTSLEGLRAEPDSTLLVPLGANTFIHAVVKDKERVLSGVGAGLSIEKPAEEAAQALAKREQEIAAELQTLSERVVRMQQEAAVLQEQLGEADSGA